MYTYTFVDEHGIHTHELSRPGRAYNPSLPITCSACLVQLWKWRDELCEKYGWESWPEALEGGYSRV